MIQELIKKLQKAPPQEALTLAHEIHSSSIDIPGKHRILLDWIGNALFRSIQKPEKLYLSKPHWEFFELLLNEKDDEIVISLIPLFTAAFLSWDDALLPVVQSCFVKVVHSCYCRLTSDAFGQLAVALVSDWDSPKSVKGLEMVKCVLEITHQSFLKSGNQKKVFNILTQKMLGPMIANTLISPSVGLDTLLDELVDQLVFHPDHMNEFFSVLEQLENSKIHSYPRQFFVLIDELLAKSQAVLPLLPKFCRFFMLKCKSVPGALTKSGFAFFRQLMMRLVVGLDETKLRCLIDLTHQVVLHNAYHFANDDLNKKHFGYLKELLQLALSTLGNPSLQLLSFEWILLLIKLDSIIIQDDIDSLWDYILYPRPELRALSCQVLMALVRFFAKDSLLDELFVKLFNYVDEKANSKQDCILVDPLFLGEYNSTISTLLPTQSLKVVQVMMLNLVDEKEQVTRKRKALDKFDKPLQLISTLFIETVKHASVRYGQEQGMDAILDRVFEDLIVAAGP